MASFKRGVVLLDDIREYGFHLTQNLQLNTTLETFSYDFTKLINQGNKVFGAHEPTILEFSIRIHTSIQARTLYNSAYQNESMRFSFLFDPEYRETGASRVNKISNYKYGLVVDGYIVHLEEEYNSDKDSSGLDRQTIIHIRLLLRSVTHISGADGKEVLTTTFVEHSKDVSDDSQLVKGNSLLRLIIWNDNKKYFEIASFTKSEESTFKINRNPYIVTPLSISLTKSIYKPNVLKVRLLFYPEGGDIEYYDRIVFDMIFLHKRVELIADGKTPVFDDYYVQEVLPSYVEGGKLYVDLTIYSLDYLLTQERTCQTFVGKRFSDIAKKLVGDYMNPYDGKSLECGDIPKNLRHLVDQNGHEHIFPYLVQYNESIYDFLRRTANRWGEFMYYEGGKLNFGYNNNPYYASQVVVSEPKWEKNNHVHCCHSISYNGSMTNKTVNDLVRNISLEAAQEFLDNLLVKDEYENPLNEMDTLKEKERGYDNYVMKKLGRAFTTNKNLPSWAADNLVADLVAYGQAKKYTDALRNQFNQAYFEHPKIGIPTLYDEQYVKEDNNNKVYNEFTENDPSAFKTYDTETYKKVLAQELSRDRETILIDFDTRYPDLALGSCIQVGDNDTDFFIVTEISMHLKKSQPVWKVKAIFSSAYEEKEEVTQKEVEREINGEKKTEQITINTVHQNVYFYPPYLTSGHTRKSGVLKAVVVDADDPMRQNRVRVKFDWQDEHGDPTPWLMVAQDGTGQGSGSHVRHYKGEQVLVDFIGGNVERPYVIGSIPNKVPLKHRWDSPIDAILRTPNGQSLLMSDGNGEGLTAFRTTMSPGFRAMQCLSPDIYPLDTIDFWKDNNKTENKRFEGNVEIKDYYNIYQIKCSTNDRQISINSPWGNVDINAFTGINISAPNGDIKISGKNVTIEAGNNLKLVSGTNIKNKFIPEDGAKSLGSNLAAEAAAKALLLFDEGGGIDLAMLRHIRDMFIKPVEGALEVQSNRFLKLEADGASTGYPASAYNNMKVADKNKMTDQNWDQTGKAIAQLIEASWTIFIERYKSYCSTFAQATKANTAFEKTVLELKEWSEATDELNNVNGTKICNLYAGLKEKLLSDSTKKIGEQDMDFVANMVGIADNTDTKQSEARKIGKRHHDIIEGRKQARTNVVTSANQLLSAIQAVKGCQFDTTLITDKKNLIGVDSYKFLPDDYMDIVKQAFSKDKCSKSDLYQMMTDLKKPDLTDDKYKKLADISNNDTQNQITALKHLLALNLLEGLGFKAMKNGKSVDISTLVESIDDLLGSKWNTTASYIVYEYDTNDGPNPFRKQKVQEKEVWSNAKNGQILISSGDPYVLGKDTKPMEHRPEDLKTERLVKYISDPIQKMMSVSVIDHIDLNDNLIGLNGEIENGPGNLTTNPKK